MASRANSGSRQEAEPAASAFDSIDDGWEEPPASAAVPALPSAPRPNSSIRELVGRRSVTQTAEAQRSFAANAAAGACGADDPIIEIGETFADELSLDLLDDVV
jgi:hypothetical protein